MSEYLTNQIITYMGNKRKLIPKIHEILNNLEEKEGRKLHVGDGFAGSGVVSRLFKSHATSLYTNDIAGYSETLNRAYLHNIDENKLKKITKYVDTANKHADKGTKKYAKNFISGNWAPIHSITEGDRVYFTEENGKRIDILRNYIETVPDEYKSFLLASLLVECSIHNNTNGQFSAFYKNGNVGQYGGKNNIDLQRITRPIMLKSPVFNNNDCDVHVQKMDTNEWVHKVPKLDLVYYDPPYNKHPYNIFYFMLDIINDWNTKMDIPDTYRGQPQSWKKSNYNSSVHAEKTLDDLIKNTKSKYILLSYNNGGIIPLDNLNKLLRHYGKVKKIPVEHKTYNRLKGISEYKRTQKKEPIKEYFWLLEKQET
jgi:adenine-specific DNA-methyltransferase